MPSRKPRLVITVTTTASSGERPALVAIASTDGDDEVAVDHLAPVIDGQDTVGVAVEGQTDIGPELDDRRPAARPDGSTRSDH